LVIGGLQVKLSFANATLQTLCEQEKRARRDLGFDAASKLKRRLADLEAAPNVAELVAGRPHPLTGDRSGQYAVDLAGALRLVFVADHDEVPRHDDGGINWPKVTNIKIVFVGDYHD
jgi:proteic killer suppression protein